MTPEQFDKRAFVEARPFVPFVVELSTATNTFIVPK